MHEVLVNRLGGLSLPSRHGLKCLPWIKKKKKKTTITTMKFYCERKIIRHLSGDFLIIPRSYGTLKLLTHIIPIFNVKMLCTAKDLPACIQCWNNIGSTLIQRHDMTLNHHWFNVVLTIPTSMTHILEQKYLLKTFGVGAVWPKSTLFASIFDTFRIVKNDVGKGALKVGSFSFRCVVTLLIYFINCQKALFKRKWVGFSKNYRVKSIRLAVILGIP